MGCAPRHRAVLPCSRVARKLRKWRPILGAARQSVAFAQYLRDRRALYREIFLRLRVEWKARKAICRRGFDSQQQQVPIVGPLDPFNAALRTLEFSRENRVLEQLHDFARLYAGLFARDQKRGALQRDVVSVERRDECWHSRAPEPASACDGEPKVEGRRLFLFGRREWLHSEQAAYDIRRVLERIIGEMGVARRGLDAAMSKQTPDQREGNAGTDGEAREAVPIIPPTEL